MGMLRFVLALLVTFSHVPGGSMPHNYGASSILAFYFISGWLMNGSYQRFREHSTHPTRDFYRDRFFKLWPLYIIVFIASITLFLATGIRNVIWHQVVTEIFIVPNAFIKMHVFGGYTIIPPAWSLGVEALFYLFVPLLTLLAYRVKLFLVYLLALGHMASVSTSLNMGSIITCPWPINPTLCDAPISDFLGFDFILFAGTAFMLGQIAHRRFDMKQSNDPHLFIIWVLYFLVFTELDTLIGVTDNLASYEVLLAMTFFLPVCLAILVYKPFKRGTRLSKIDFFLGDLSYPLFLVHFFALYVIQLLVNGAYRPVYAVLVWAKGEFSLIEGKQNVLDFLSSWSLSKGVFLPFPALLIYTLVLSLTLSLILAWVQARFVEKARIRQRGFKSLRQM